MKNKGNKEDKMRQLGTTPIFKLLLQQSLPNIISLWSISLYQLVNSMFVGKYLNEAGLAAQSVFSPIEYLTCTSLPVAYSIGAVSLIGPALGQNNIKLACTHLTQYLYWSLMYIAIVPALFLPFLDAILRFMGAATDEILMYARQYAVVLLSVGPLVYTPNGGFLPLFRVENRAVTAMWVQISSSVLNLVLNFICFPTLGQKLHLYVPAMSTCLSLAATGFYTCLNYFGCFKKSVLKFTAKVKPNCKTISTIVVQAFPQFLNALPNQLGILIANVQIKNYCKTKEQTKQLIACMSVLNNLGQVIIQPRLAIYFGFISILSFNVGSKNYKRVLELFRVGFWSSVILVGLLTALMLGIAGFAATWFHGTPEFQAMAAKTFRIAAFGYPFGGPLMFCSGIYQMERRPVVASVFQGMRLAVYIVLLVVIPLLFNIESIFYAFSIADTSTGLVGVICYWVIYRKYQKLEKAAAEPAEPSTVPASEKAGETVEQDVLHGDK